MNYMETLHLRLSSVQASADRLSFAVTSARRSRNRYARILPRDLTLLKLEWLLRLFRSREIIFIAAIITASAMG
jgi:hypothetical protein